MVIKEKIVYPTDVPHLHGFCTFSVPHLKIVVPHLKLKQLATLSQGQIDNEIEKENRLISPLRMWNELAPNDTKRRTSTTISTTTIRRKRSKKY